ncbi:MAG: UbiA family prenyltransferase [Pseudomonadota bacterium]
MTVAALWTYQKERFPLAKTAPLLAVFSSASLCVSATLAGRPVPDPGAFGAAFAVAFLLFFQMRVCDEVKDLEDDRRYRPDRPIPRGLVSVQLIGGLGVGSLPLTALAVWLWHAPALWLLALVWAWLAAMTLEFGAAAWLKARPVHYLLSHMAIMPLLNLLLTGLEWLPGGGQPGGLWVFLALSFANGCVLEIGRKLWASEAEIDGVDSYSRLWGPRRAACVWAACLVVAFALLLALSALTGAFALTLAIGGAAALLAIACAVAYARAPEPAPARRLDKAAGLWVFVCYALAGFAPFGAEMLP